VFYSKEREGRGERREGGRERTRALI